MAAAENIKEALRALEEEVAWADNLAMCFVAAAGEQQGLNEPPWVACFARVLDVIGRRLEVLAQAVNHGL